MSITNSKINGAVFAGLLLLVTLVGSPSKCEAQHKHPLDTIECHIVGFSFGTMFPSNTLSKVTMPSGETSQNATMHSLYKSPWLDFGVNGFYKYKSNWLVSLDANLWFGNDNLSNRTTRMPNVFSQDDIIIGTNGTDAVVTCYNRGLSFKAGVGKIFPLFPSKNPNSGILARLNGGWMQQQTIFMINDVNAPQIDGDYALLYDHQRRGFILTEGIGYWFMSNYSNLINLYVTFEVSQCWSHSTRDFMIDNYLGLHGKDNNSYFDLLFSVKLCWMFPLKGKSSQEYYYW